MLVIPADFLGEDKKKSQYTNSVPREWTQKELDWVLNAIAEGHSVDAIADALGRTKVSVSTKLKRLTKSNDTYNVKNRELKYQANSMFIQQIEPASVLDVFAGNSFYLNAGISKVVTNDKDEKFVTDFHDDALVLMCKLYAAGQKFDVIDLDPYGSAYECIPLALKMARKGLVISFGEWGHKRWKRFDFVRPRYGISSVDDFHQDAFFAELKRLARLEKKDLQVVDAIQYSNFLRVYCSLEKLTITEQWDVKHDV